MTVEDLRRLLLAAFVCVAVLLTWIWFVGCGGPDIVPPPQEINGVAVEYREGHFEGPAVGGFQWRSTDDGLVPTVWLEDLRDMEPGAQWFIIAHELYHGRGADSELAADCCAGKTFARWAIPFGDAATHLLRRSFTDADHPDGAVRSFTFLTCYGTGPDYGVTWGDGQ